MAYLKKVTDATSDNGVGDGWYVLLGVIITHLIRTCTREDNV